MFSKADKVSSNHISRSQQNGGTTFFRKAGDETLPVQQKQSHFFGSVIQPKLSISSPDDPQEKEADAIADKVMRMPEPMAAAPMSNKDEDKLHRKEEEPLQTKTDATSINRRCTACSTEEKKLQRKEVEENEHLHANTSSYISTLNNKGNHLPKQSNEFFSSNMGYDFSNVKIHTDKEAASSAKELHAKAYTIGNNIVFNEGQYNTDSAEGKRLIAHELTHVVQQNDKQNKINRYTTTESGGTHPARIQEVNHAMNRAAVLIQNAIRGIQSILISGEREPNRPIATALKALFHCPTLGNIQSILADFQNVQSHFNAIQQLIISYNPLPLEAEYDEALHSMTLSTSFFELSGPEKSLRLLTRIITPLYYMHTTVQDVDFTNFSIPGDRMIGNEFSMEMFLSFVQRPYSFDAFGNIPCLQTTIQSSEPNLRYSNTGFYVLVPRTLTSDTYLRRLTGYETPRTGDIVGELLRDRFGLFIFYKSQRVYVNQHNRVMFPF